MSRRLDWLLPSWLEDASAYSQSINEDMISVMYTILVNFTVLILCVMIYSIYRQYNDKVFAPKCDMFPDRVPPKISNATTFGWVCELWNIDDNVIIEKGGYDILFLIRFYRLCFKILAFSAIYCWSVLLPINGTGNVTTDYSSFDRWSMTNIMQGSSRCWFHLLGIYILSGITIYFLEQEFVIYAKYRHIFLRQTHAHLRTVLIEGIPHKMRSPLTLRTYLEALYPNSILHVRLAQNLKYLERLIEKRENVVAELERCLYLNKYSHYRPTVHVGSMLQQVDAIRHYSQTLDDLNKAVAKEQKAARKLANYETKSSNNKHDGKVIDEFLKFTEIGYQRQKFDALDPAKRLSMTQSSGGTIALPGIGNSNSGSGSFISHPETDIEEDIGLSSYQQQQNKTFGGSLRSNNNSNNTNTTKKTEFQIDSASDADDSEDDGDYYTQLSRSRHGISNNNHRTFRTYHMTWSEFFWALWTSPSLWDCWRVIKEGRLAEDHDYNPNMHMHHHRSGSISSNDHNNSNHGGEYSEDDEETFALISPPEERRLFLSKAFVTFKTFTAATTARQVVHMQLAGHMSISEAPEPTDITWNNLYTTRKGVLWRRFVVEIAVLLLIIVWVAPVTLLSFIFSKDAICGISTSIGNLCNSSQLFESTVELAQPLVLVAIMNLLPPILTFLGVVEGRISFSGNQMKAFDRYFTFQIINVFLVTTIAGSVIDCVKEIYLKPSSTFELLGSSLPKMGGFFTNYLLVKAFTGLGMELMRFPGMFSNTIKLLFTSNLTPRDRRAIPLFGSVRQLSNPGWFPYAKIYAQDMLLFVVSATYACISPLILAAGMCYFAGASFVYKHQMLYVYEPIFETGGKWWPKMARCCVVALLFAQCTMVGMMILKETFTEIYFLVLIIAVTTSYYYYIASTYEPLANQLPLDMAMSMDNEINAGNLTVINDLHGAEDYTQPPLRAGDVEPEVEFPIDDKKESPIAV